VRLRIQVETVDHGNLCTTSALGQRRGRLVGTRLQYRVPWLLMGVCYDDEGCRAHTSVERGRHRKPGHTERCAKWYFHVADELHVQ